MSRFGMPKTAPQTAVEGHHPIPVPLQVGDVPLRDAEDGTADGSSSGIPIATLTAPVDEV